MKFIVTRKRDKNLNEVIWGGGYTLNHIAQGEVKRENIHKEEPTTAYILSAAISVKVKMDISAPSM